MDRPHATYYEYRFVPECPANGLDGQEESCLGAVQVCLRSGQGPGPLSRVYRRPANSNAAWAQSGLTCLPQPPTRTTVAPALTYTLIRNAWATTRFAIPTTTVQPPGNHTLVRLPVYLTVTWPPTGYPPGSTRSLTLAGQPVRIRPTLAYVDYHHGDGTTTRTTSLGGPYPTGDVTHTYTTPGTRRLRTTIGYSGQYSIAGRPWQPINETIPITGATATLHIHTATTELVPSTG